MPPRKFVALLWLAALRAPQSTHLPSTSLAAQDEDHIVLLQTRSFVTQNRTEGPALTNTSPGASKLLHAHSRLYVNIFTASLVFGVSCLVAFAPFLSKERWVALMVFASYLILIPGLVTKDFGLEIALRVQDYAATVPGIQRLDPFNVLVPLLPERISVTVQNGVQGPIHQSTRSFVPFLWRTGSHSGAVMIAIFAFGVPVAKLLLLAIGECWRHHSDALRVKTARLCILTVQLISKWASPDMFAFMLLYYLVRELDHPPLIESLQVFDVGFSCYNIFCVASVVSTLLVTLPDVPGEAAVKGTSSIVPRWLGHGWLAVLTLCLTLCWAILFVYGLVLPCLSVRVDLASAMESAELPAPLVRVVSGLHIEDMVDSDVSLWSCACALWAWFCESGELTLLLSAFMISVFVIGLTVLSMLLLVVVSLCAQGGQGTAANKPNNCSTYALHASYVVKHLAMLDVCVTGTVVVACTAAVYKSSGLVVGVLPGTYMLLGAEVTHYTAYYTITWLAEALANQELQ